MSALTHTAGTIRLYANERVIEFNPEHAFISDYIIRLARALFSVEPLIEGKRIVFRDGIVMLKLLGILTESGNQYMINAGIAPEIIKRDCDKIGYIMGAFLGCGSVTILGNGGYHMEFSVVLPEFADELKNLLSYFGITARIAEKKDDERYLVYIKDNKDISECLSIMGANFSMMKLSNVVIFRQLHSKANRMFNCDMANINRQTTSADAQKKAILYIQSVQGLDKLDPKIAAAARCRLLFSSEPNKSLAERLHITKSGLIHRMNKLIEYARDLAEKQGVDYDSLDIADNSPED